MKRILLILLCILVSFSSTAYKKPRFKPYEIQGLEKKPDFWKVRPSEVIDICSNVRKGRVEIAARTPLGYPVYAVYYGDFSEGEPTTNWSAGNSSSTKKAYLGKESHPQTIMLVAGVHGSEPESVAAAMNMIQLLETGKDFRGREDAEFLDLASRYRIIIMPCVNMDGRLVCPDHFRCQPYEVFRAASQGVWKDGSLIGWLGSKEWFPLPLERVSFPGGYPNSEGVNIQHDVTPGDMKSAEAEAVCRVAAKWRVDFCLNSHTCEGVPFVRYPSQIETPYHIELGREISDAANRAIFDAGLVGVYQQQKPSNETLNLTNIINWCSGGLGLTLECAHSCYTSRGYRYEYTFDQMMEPPFIVMKVIMKRGLEVSLSGR